MVGIIKDQDQDEYDREAAFFHLRQAANLGIDEALVNLAKIYMQLPHDILVNFELPQDPTNWSVGFDYMLQSADKGNKNSIYHVAKAYDSQSDWIKACEYYQRILNMCEDGEEGDTLQDIAGADMECEPVYLILARLAEINYKGGNGIDKDLGEAAALYSEAADKAMAFGKGRLANKYFMLSEQAMSEQEEE
jgi:elongation factor 2 kinase